MRYSIAILMALCVLPALADAPAVQSAPADVELAVAENDALTVTARQGQSVRIRLGGNATTGYEWTLDTMQSKTYEKGKAREILSPVGKMEYQLHPAVGMVGVGGEFVATFRAVKPGTVKLTFAYKRPWEKDKKPIRNFSVKVKVIPVEKNKNKEKE